LRQSENNLKSPQPSKRCSYSAALLMTSRNDALFTSSQSLQHW